MSAITTTTAPTSIDASTPPSTITSTPDLYPSTIARAIASPTTSFIRFTPAPKQSAGQGTLALKIALPVLVGFCLLCIILLYIRSWIRRKRDGSSSRGSVAAHDDPERKGAAATESQNPAETRDDGEAAAAERAEGEDGLKPLPDANQGVKRQSVRRDSRAISERRRSERRSLVPEQFVDPPKDYRRGRKSSAIHMEKMAPP